MRVEALKGRGLEAIERNSEWIVSVGEEAYKTPELGFKEFKTFKLCESLYRKLDLPYKSGIAITGSIAFIGEGRPRVGIIGEMDSIICHEHPDSDPITGAVHAYGHNAQIAATFGVAIGLVESIAIEAIEGSVALMAVPAEEYLEIEYRLSLREKGKLEFLGGKQELIRLGALDDVDLVLTSHIQTKHPRDKVVAGGTNNGFIKKMDETLTEILRSNATSLIGEGRVLDGEHSTGSTDMGDVSAVVPSVTIGQGGVEGRSHRRDFRIVDKDIAYVLPAQAMATVAIDLLYDGAKKAREILNSFKPKVNKSEYVDFMRNLVS